VRRSGETNAVGRQASEVRRRQSLASEEIEDARRAGAGAAFDRREASHRERDETIDLVDRL